MENSAFKRPKLSEEGEETSQGQNVEERLVKTIEEEPRSEFPSLVFALLVANVKDAAFLKAARLVCKSWNTEATPALRACSIVTLDEISRFDGFVNVLANGRIGPIADLPSPFQYFHVKTAAFVNGQFINFFGNKSLVVRKWTLCTSFLEGDEDEEVFEFFWERHKETLEEVSLTVAVRTLGFPYKFIQTLQISRGTESLKIRNNKGCSRAWTEYELLFLQTKLKDLIPSTLVSIYLDEIIDDEIFMKAFMAIPGILENLKRVEVMSGRVDSEASDSFFGNAKELEVLVLGPYVEITNAALSSRVAKIPSLEALTFYWNSDLSVEVVRGCLTHVKKIDIPNGIGGFKEAMDELRESLPGLQLAE